MIELPSDVIAKTLLALADANAAPVVDPAPAFVSAVDPVVKDTVVRFVRAIDEPLERRFVAPLILEELVFRLLRTDAAAVLRAAVVRDRDADSIQQAMRYMRARAMLPLSVEDVARHVGMSPSHFAHRFRAVARTSPMRYLKQLRLQEARALLLSDGLRIGEVATRVGYESASHFTRDFKSYFGATPAEYLRRLRSAGSGETTAALDIVEPRDAN
jgi:AraC-like DNA-binding protein